MSFKLNNEAKTGALVLVSFTALAVLIFKVGNFNVLEKGYILKTQFHYTAGVKRHAPVRLSGVDVGEVKDIRLIYGQDTVIELDLWIRDGVRVRTDSKAYVTTLGMMGEKYIELKDGTAGAAYAKPGEAVPGEDPVRLEDLVEIGKNVAENVSDLAEHIDDTVTDNRSKIDSIFDNLEETSYNFNDFSQDIRFHPWKILAKGKEKSRVEIEKEMSKIRAEREAKKINSPLGV